MKKYILCLLWPWAALVAQESIQGIILLQEGSASVAVEGANVYWEGTDVGTTTDATGAFRINKTNKTNQLIIRYLGFITDTLTVASDAKITHFLTPDLGSNLDEVTVVQRRKAIQKSFLKAQNIYTVNSAELLKAACCNLSESFETNPSIDVNFSDAITGTKQIRMLGLTSPYLMITEENIPMIRGASQAYGLTFIPGTWIESIQITKGAGSVVNGYESISGQINAELKKPFSDVPFFANLFSSVNGRNEVNLHGNVKLSDKWSTGIYVHGNQRTQRFDKNQDNFLDLPLSKQLNFFNRWQYTNPEKGWVSFLSFRWMEDQKQLGMMDYRPELHRNKQSVWGSEIDTQRFDSSLKIGYVFPELSYQSFGLQMAFSRHDQKAYYGYRNYNIEQQSFFANLLFNSIIGNTKNKFKSGINVTHDRYIEQVDQLDFNRVDYAVGGFFEYSYDSLEDFSLVTGLRLDHHNRLGTFLTPRVHLRYLPVEKTVVRASLGSGRKSANLFAENQTLFGTNRELVIRQNGGSIYGLRPEKAWNYGLSVRRTFSLGSQEFDFTADYYVTRFTDRVVVDWEKESQIAFYNLEGKSQANSLQLELDYNPSKNWSFRFAYKNEQVKTDYDRGYFQNPLTPKHRFFGNMGWENERNEKGAQWRWDLTFHQLGKQRLVATTRDPQGSFAPAYGLWNTQWTRAFNQQLEVYSGLENIGNYRQNRPIIGAEDPFGTIFDAAQVYAPIFGRMIYMGLRWNLN